MRLHLILLAENVAQVEEGQIIAAAQAGEWVPLDGPLEILVFFKLARPKRLQTKKTAAVRLRSDTLPDLFKRTDMIRKALAGLAWSKPQQVASVCAWKAYVDDFDDPGVEILVRSLDFEWPQPRERGGRDPREEWARKAGIGGRREAGEA